MYIIPHIAEQCEVLLMGFAHVGIIALIDEVTGYETLKAKRALAKILEDYIAKELQPWTKTFGLDFSMGIARLRGWEPAADGRFPRAVAGYINSFVYARLEQGVLNALREKNPIENGRHKAKHHQWLSRNKGYPALKTHISTLLAFMRAASNWGMFQRMVERAFPVLHENYHLPFKEDLEGE